MNGAAMGAVLVALLLLGAWYLIVRKLRRPPWPLLRVALLFFASFMAGVVLISKIAPILLVPLALLWIPLEEILKYRASRPLADRPIDAALAVSLFGVLELGVAKAFFLAVDESFLLNNTDPLQLTGFSLFAAAPVLLHVVTAMIYAFSRMSAARKILLCVAIHWCFNQSRGIYLMFGTEVSPAYFSSAAAYALLAADVVVLIFVSLALGRILWTRGPRSAPNGATEAHPA